MTAVPVPTTPPRLGALPSAEITRRLEHLLSDIHVATRQQVGYPVNQDSIKPALADGGRNEPWLLGLWSNSGAGGAASMAQEKFAVQLSVEDRSELERLTRSGQHSARVINRARILLKPESTDATLRCWSDEG